MKLGGKNRILNNVFSIYKSGTSSESKKSKTHHSETVKPIEAAALFTNINYNYPTLKSEWMNEWVNAHVEKRSHFMYFTGLLIRCKNNVLSVTIMMGSLCICE